MNNLKRLITDSEHVGNDFILLSLLLLQYSQGTMPLAFFTSSLHFLMFVYHNVNMFWTWCEYVEVLTSPFLIRFALFVFEYVGMSINVKFSGGIASRPDFSEEKRRFRGESIFSGGVASRLCSERVVDMISLCRFIMLAKKLWTY